MALAMEKDRARRYAAVQELIADVSRHLNHQPVQARAPSRIYLVRKFVRRNRAAVIAAALITLALIVGLIGTTFGMSRARRSELAARRSELAAQRQAYKANIAAAYAGVQNKDGSLVWRSLSAATESHRGWERHFLSRLAGGNGLVQRLPTGTFDACAASSDVKLIATADKSRIRVWDRASGAMIATAHLTDDVVTHIAISPDHELMLAGGLKQTTMFALKSGTALWTRIDGVSFRAEQFTLDHSAVVLATAHPPGLLLVNPRDGSTIRNYSVQGGSARRRWRPWMAGASSFLMEPAGSLSSTRNPATNVGASAASGFTSRGTARTWPCRKPRPIAGQYTTSRPVKKPSHSCMDRCPVRPFRARTADSVW